MTADTTMILVAYALSIVAVVIGIYALWALSEFKEKLKRTALIERRLNAIANTVNKPATKSYWRR